MEEIKSQN